MIRSPAVRTSPDRKDQATDQTDQATDRTSAVQNRKSRMDRMTATSPLTLLTRATFRLTLLTRATFPLTGRQQPDLSRHPMGPPVRTGGPIP